MSDFEETYGSSVNARMASHAGEGPDEPVDDLDRFAEAGEPPVEGAQWDEVHRRWEVWDEEARVWRIAGDDTGDGIAPGDENPFPSLLARELALSDELEPEHVVVSDVERVSPGSDPAPRGAQWNEVSARWERWDEEADAWVEATVESEPPDPG